MKARQKDFSFVNFENPLYFFKVKIAKEKVVLEKNVFCEMFLKFNFTWKYSWSKILMTVKECILRLNEIIIMIKNKHHSIQSALSTNTKNIKMKPKLMIAQSQIY